jgi:hypothetical protein
MPYPSTTRKPPKARAIRFAFAEPIHRRERAARRRKVAEYVETWIGGRIVSELITGRRCFLVVAVPKPISAAAAEDHAQECPGYVRGSCELLEE